MIYNRFHGVHNKKKKYSYYLLAAKSYSDAVSKLEKRYEDYSILRIKDLMEVSEGSVIYIYELVSIRKYKNTNFYSLTINGINLYKLYLHMNNNSV